MIKKLCIGIIITISLIVSPHQAFALVGAYEGVSFYSSWIHPPCAHGDRAGAQYCNNLHGMLGNAAFPNTYFTFYNNLANEGHITSGDINNADFYVYSGHGHNYQYESSAHFYARSTGESWHDSTMEDYSSVNASTNQALEVLEFEK